MKRILVPLATIVLLFPAAIADDPPATRRVTLKFGASEREPFNPQRWLFSPEMVADNDGTVRLAKSSLVTNEVGATDHQHVETLSELVWAKVGFPALVESYDLKNVSRADLYVYGNPTRIMLRGKPLTGVKRHESTGWMRVSLPLEDSTSLARMSLHLGHGGTLLYEPQQDRGRSEKSVNGGRTWTPGSLGRDGKHSGEYLIRLRLAAAAQSGWTESPVFDLWKLTSGDPPTPGSPHDFAIAGLERGASSRIAAPRAEIRLGSTPAPDPEWSGWLPLSTVASGRWAQLRISLASSRGESSNVPGEFSLAYSFHPAPSESVRKCIVTRPVGVKLPRQTSINFIYETPSPRLKHLREHYQLDKVIAPGTTEMEQLMLLRHWVRNQWHTAWGTHPAAWMPPWDTLQILACKDQPDCLTMCTHYAAVFVQCCLALGWNARHCILDHHCTAEVWVDQYQKWVMMDSGNSPTRPDCNLHFERNGVPQSALELHLAYHQKKSDGLIVCFTPKKLMDAIGALCRKPPAAHTPGSPRPETAPVVELKNYPVCGLENYRRYAFPGRNNYLTSLYPGELYQGWAEYFYDGYWWVGDERDDPKLSPEYSKHLPPSRPQDIDWDLNWTRIHLARAAKKGELQVDLETLTPNLERLEIARGEQMKFESTPASFIWKLAAGRNVLHARGVNAWGRMGKSARVEVEWKE